MCRVVVVITTTHDESTANVIRPDAITMFNVTSVGFVFKFARLLNRAVRTAVIVQIITARRLASAVCTVYAVIACVCLSHASIVSKRLSIGTRKQRHTITQGFYSFLTPKTSAKLQRRHT